ncbi:hypothetical protein ZWY2020_045624 [Hordeum vulgare]|nr:hypothetical protein ZWY2020_045624 [Hordeum vulgare]
MAATAAEKPQEPRRDADGEPSGAPAGLDPGPGSRDGALTPEPTDMPAPVVAVAVAESSSARKLGRLFRLTEVHLWDDFYVKPHDWRATETTDCTGSQTAKTHNKAAKQTDEVVIYHSFVEDMELASLMGSLGLPVSFSTRKEVTSGRQAPYEAATPMDDNVRTCTNSEELEHVQESMDCMEQTNSCVSSRAAAGYSEVYHGDVDKTLGEDSVNQCEQNDNMSSPVKSGSPVQENQAADSFMQLNKVMLGQNSVDNESIMSTAELCHEEKSSEREDKISGETPPMSHDNNDPCLAEPSPVNNHVEKSGSDFYYECGDWQVLWDQFYSRYYYYNIQTQESTWDPPQGLEDFISYCSTYSSQGIDLQYGASEPIHLDEQRHDLYNEAQSLSGDKSRYIQGVPDYTNVVPFVIATIDEVQDGENRQNDSSVAEALEVNQEATTTKKKKRMDEEGWFSVTPEPIAKHHASRVGAGILIDCFTGVGGNTIQFAAKCNHVVAVDIDPQKIDCAQHNATVYGVNDHIDFIIGDFICIAPHLKLLCAGRNRLHVTSMGWTDYAKVDVYDIKTMLKPCDGDLDQLADMCLSIDPPWAVEVEKNYLNGKLKAITA